MRLQERMDGKKKTRRKRTGISQMIEMKEKIGLDACATNGRIVIGKVGERLASQRDPRQKGPRQKDHMEKGQKAAFITISVSNGHVIKILCESFLVEPCM